LVVAALAVGGMVLTKLPLLVVLHSLTPQRELRPALPEPGTKMALRQCYEKQHR
jgi:hypothetical protein